MRNLEKDFYRKEIKKTKINEANYQNNLTIQFSETLNDDPLTDTEFYKIRTEVLSSWRTGKEVQDTDIRKESCSKE